MGATSFIELRVLYIFFDLRRISLDEMQNGLEFWALGVAGNDLWIMMSGTFRRGILFYGATNYCKLGLSVGKAIKTSDNA